MDRRKGHVLQTNITKKGGSSQKRNKIAGLAKNFTVLESTRCHILELPAGMFILRDSASGLCFL
jgi:hypothetical protein